MCDNVFNSDRLKILASARKKIYQKSIFGIYITNSPWEYGAGSKMHPMRLSINLHDHFKSTWLSCRVQLWRNSKQEFEKSMWPKWEIHVPNWVPNWRLTLWQWLLFEWWIKILFAIRKYQFLCSTTQICAQHGVLNENFLQKVAAKFNLTVFRGSFSRLTFWVRRRTCLY